MNDNPETIMFRKLETLLESRNLEFTPPMRFQYWHDPNFKAVYTLIMELFEKFDATSTWNPWDEFEGDI